MTRYYSDDAVQKMNGDFLNISEKADKLKERFVLHPFQTAQGKEYAQHGFARRIDGLAHCMTKVFEAVPPGLEGIPDRDALVEAAINIQAFVINVAGCCDNIAWTWVYERGIKQADGSAPKQNMVGLTSDHRVVWKSFPKDYRSYLSKRRPWLKHLKAFRDSLAHRIPLYIPPYTIDPDDVQRHQQLEEESFAALRDGNIDLHEEINAMQDQLKRFSPFMVHSFSEASPTALFHPQMISDFLTVEELGFRLLDELAAQNDVI